MYYKAQNIVLGLIGRQQKYVRGSFMQADKAVITRLIKTARGQLDCILKMVEDDRYCIDISNQILAADAILRKANREIVRAHMKGCVKSAFEDGDSDKKIDELVDMIDKMTK